MRPFTKSGTTCRKAIVAVLSLLIVSSGILLFFGSGTMSATEDVGDDAVAASSPMVDASSFNRFIANEGQWSSSIGFVATTNFGSAAFASDGFYYYLPAPENVTEVVSFKFVGANGVAPSGASKLSSTSNYLVGSDPSSWRIGVPEYGKIVYSDLWDGVDMVFSFVEGELKYELTVAAGVSADPIAVQVSGAVMEVRDGELIVSTASNSIVDGGLVAYYADDHAAVHASFAVRDDMYSFELGRDVSRAAVIDPLVYSTYLGGSSIDEGHDIAVDPSGCVYVIGNTPSTDFPTSGEAYQTSRVGYSDAFVTKFNADGSLAYSTYLGGSNGETGNSIAVDASGCAYVTGFTNSADFPTTEGAVQTSYGGDNYDAFVTKLDPAGGLAYSTYLGGGNYDQGNSIAVDASGCAYVTGETWSGNIWPWNFPFTDGAYQTTKGDLRDTFVTKLSADGSEVVYSTFLGGNGTDISYGIAVDANDCAYVTGYSYSTNFPVTAGAFQGYPGDGNINAFVTKLSADGSALAFSTYLGGSGHEIGNGIAVDVSGCVHVTGHTTSADFPLVDALQASLGGGYDAFVTKLDPDGSALAYSTYLGGSGDEGYGTSKHQLDVAVDPSGSTYVAGFTSSTDFPLTSGAYQTANGGSYDAFVAKLGPAGGLAYSTYLGGGEDDYGHGIALGSPGCVYVIGETDSFNFPVTDDAYQSILSGYYWSDAFVTKLSLVPGMPSSLTAIPGLTNISLSWTAPAMSSSETLDNYTIYQDGVRIAVVTNTAFLVTGLTTDREYTFSVSARNVQGDGTNATVSATPGIYVAVEAVASSQYANASTGGQLVVDVSAESGLSSITLLSANVSHHVDGVLIGNEPIVVSGGAYSNAFLPSLAIGINVFTYTFNDSVGNSISTSVTVVYDVTEPTIDIGSPTNGALIDIDSITVSWTAGDDLSGIAHYDVRLDDAAPFRLSAAVMEHTFSELADGQHLVIIIAVDGAGNERSVEVSFTVDTTAPTVEILAPTDAFINTDSPTMQWAVRDATSGVKAIEYSTDGTSWFDAAGATSYLWSGLADGAYTFYVRAEDNAGNSATDEVSFVVDTVAPTIDFLSPTDGSYLDTGSVTIDWTTSDERSGIAKVEHSTDGASWTIVTGSSCTLSFADGAHTVLVRATDNAGNVHAASVGFIVDTVAPSVVITGPINGSFNNTGSVTASWITIDVTSGLKIVLYSIDGTVWTDADEATSFVWSGLADGPHTFYVRVEDRAGNQNATSVSFIVDTVSPNIAIDEPVDDSFHTLGSVTVGWTASDDRAGIAYFEVSVMHDGTLSRSFQVSALDSSNLLSGLADGTYVVTVKAVDHANNVNESSVGFVVDTVVPTVAITSPTDAFINTGSVTASWTASDVTSGIRIIQYSTDGASWFDADDATSYLWSGLADGPHTFYVRAEDNAGNVNEASLTFVSDVVAPAVDIASPNDGSYLSADLVGVEWNASDATSGISTVEYSIDGTVWTVVAGSNCSLVLADGAHDFVLRVTDNAGNAREETISFVVDTLAPAIGIVSPSNGAYLNTDSVTISWAASDVYGITAVEYSTDGVSWIATSNSTFVWSDLADGTHIFHVRATDRAGNSATDQISFTVDTVAPTLDGTPAGSSVPVDEPVVGSFSEPMNQTSVSVSVDGIDGTVSWSGDVMTFTPSSALAYGTTYTVVVSGKDLAGNELSSSWSFTTMKDEGIVSGTITGPDGNPVAGATVTLGNTTTTTDENGRFVLRNVTSGTYELTVSKDGYEALTERVTVIAGETADLGALSVRSVSSIGVLVAAVVAVAAVLVVVAFMLVRRKT